MAYGVEMTDEEIYALPVVMTFKQAARAHGIGTKRALQMRKDGTLPFPIQPRGKQWVTTRTQLLESLGLPLRTGLAQSVEGAALSA